MFSSPDVRQGINLTSGNYSGGTDLMRRVGVKFKAKALDIRSFTKRQKTGAGPKVCEH